MSPTKPIKSISEQPQSAANTAPSVIETAKRVLRIESEAIAGLIERLDQRFESAV